MTSTSNQASDEAPELVPLSAVAKTVGVHYRTVRRWVASGVLEGVNVGSNARGPSWRVTVAEAERFAAERAAK